MTHEQKPESAEFRTRAAPIETMTVHYMETGFPINAARRLARDGVVEAEARGAAEQRRKDAELSKAQLFCQREKEAADRTLQRDDVKQWQTDQRQFYLSSMIEVVTEYAEWRDKKDAEEPGIAGYIPADTPNFFAISKAKYASTAMHRKPFPNDVPVYYRPANVTALEARVKELEGYEKDAMRFRWLVENVGLYYGIPGFAAERGRLPEKRVDDLLRVIDANIERSAAAIREGGEHG